MIIFNNQSQEKPYQIFRNLYDKALSYNQKNIEAISIASFDKAKNEVDSRFVNLKFINDENFIFFTNYNSPKSSAFKSHNQISALFFWSTINVQIRMKAKIDRTSIKFNKEYFKSRSIDKNALAISSDQSKTASSYNEVIEKYKSVKNFENLSDCPVYWGGFSFTPYYFEIWEGHELRINSRNVFKKNGKSWQEYYLQP